MPDVTPKPGQFFCPHCGTKNPPYDFVHNVGGTAQMRVAYLTVVCGGNIPDGEVPCRRILSVAVLACEISRVPMVGG